MKLLEQAAKQIEGKTEAAAEDGRAE